MSSLFSIGSRLHVYFTRDSEQTGWIDKLCRLTLQLYDRDVVLHLDEVEELGEQGLLTLLVQDELLRQAGHRLILDRPSPALQASLASYRVEEIFSYA